MKDALLPPQQRKEEKATRNTKPQQQRQKASHFYRKPKNEDIKNEGRPPVWRHCFGDSITLAWYNLQALIAISRRDDGFLPVSDIKAYDLHSSVMAAIRAFNFTEEGGVVER